MECFNCNVQKLSTEFPRCRLSKGCNHRPSWCLRCLVGLPEKRCPECGLDYESRVYDDMCHLLCLVTQSDSLKPPAMITTPPSKTTDSKEIVSFKVSLLGGESKECKKATSTSIADLMKYLEYEFHVAPSFQRLMFNGLQLQRFSDHGEESQIRDYNISNGASLQLMKMLLSVSQEAPYDFLVFRLSWQRGRNMGQSKYLDASCFAYSGRHQFGYVDFKNTRKIHGMDHSGPAQNRMKHRLVVSLANVDPGIHAEPYVDILDISHLFFVMSACYASTLREFESPTVSLIDYARPTQQLASYSFVTQGTSMAVIMCCMKRTEHGWEAFSLGQASDGHCHNYKPIHITIAKLFDSQVV